MCGNLEILRKTFFIGKKSNFNFQKNGVFWSKKWFSDFSQNFVRWSSDDVNVPPFRFLWRHVIKWKKIRFEVWRFGKFCSNSQWVIGVFLQVRIFSWGLTWHFFSNHELWNFLCHPCLVRKRKAIERFCEDFSTLTLCLVELQYLSLL